MDAILKDIEKLVEDLVSAWNEQDLSKILACMTEDVIWDDPALPSPAEGKEEVKQFCEVVLRAFPDFHYKIRNPICVDEGYSRCAVPFRITATNVGPMDPPGYGPSGKSVEFEGLDLLELRDGVISRITTYFNIVAVAEKLLAMQVRPPVGSRSERVLVWFQRVRAGWIRRGIVPRE